MAVTVTDLFIYPVKSLGGIRVDEAAVESRGLAFDRRWMVIDPSGQFITQRQVPAMATFRLTPGEGTGNFTVTAPPGESLAISAAHHGVESIAVTVWKDTLLAYPGASEADDFLTRHLGLPCRLVYMGNAMRQVNRKYADPGRITSFADGYPILVTSLSSLEDLNRRMAEALPMDRFRANIVVGGCPTFAEDSWGTIRIGTAVLKAVKPCTRCTVTTIDQVTGEKAGKEPLKTLASFRNTPKGVIFGENLIVIQPGVVRVGDTVEHLAPRGTFPLAHAEGGSSDE